jgi:hypothetical protein
LDDGGVVGCALPHHRRQLLGALLLVWSLSPSFWTMGSTG